MSESDQFRQYAEEALLWAAQSTTKEEKQLLLELVCTWTQAAVASERTVTGPVVNLMEALRRSVETERGVERRKPARAGGNHRAPKKAGPSSARAKKAS